MVVKALETIALARVDDGTPGKPGADGKTPYFHIAYADSSNGNTNFSLDTPGSRKYIGQYTDFTQADSTNPAAYKWQLVQGPKGAQGPQGPQGPAGNDITSYASGTALPTTVAPANSQFWLTNSAGVAIKFYKSTGNAWVEQQISAAAINAATFNGLNFNGVTFNGSTFNSTFTNVQPDGFAYKVHGDSTLSNGSLVTNAYNDSNVQVSHTEVNQSGLLAQGFISGNKVAEINLREGQLLLGAAYKASSTAPDRWTSSALDAEKISQLNATGTVLWEGVSLMGWSGDAQKVTPSKKITDCLNGWKLIWGEYKNGAFNGTQIRESEISKASVLKYSGAGRVLSIMNYDNVNCSKYVYAYADHIDGNTKNSDGAAGGVVLIGVYEY